MGDTDPTGAEHRSVVRRLNPQGWSEWQSIEDVWPCTGPGIHPGNKWTFPKDKLAEG